MDGGGWFEISHRLWCFALKEVVNNALDKESAKKRTTIRAEKGHNESDKGLPR